MLHETSLNYTQPIIAQVVFAFWRRSIGIGYFFALALTAVFHWRCYCAGQNIMASWRTKCCAGFGGICCGVFVFFHYRDSMNRGREMGSLKTVFRVKVATFTVISGIRTTTLQWFAIKDVWQFSDVWLLLCSKAQFSTLPLANLSPQMQAIGGKVVC